VTNYMSIAEAYDQRKNDAYLFLQSVEKALNAKLPPPSELRTQIRKLNAESKADKLRDYLRLPESAFLNTFYSSNFVGNDQRI
jgi:hypothetical protein